MDGWEFSGGKIEEGESPEQALVREMEEELDICSLRSVNWLPADLILLPKISAAMADKNE